MRFQVLGPLRVEAGEAELRLRPGMPQRVLATLLLRARRSVMVSELIDFLWPEGPPVNAVKVVQTYVHRLRTDLGSGHRIFRDSGGYRIDVNSSDVDSDVFVAEIAQARQARDAAQLERAESLLDQALRRWRGRPYGDLASGPLFEPEIARLEQWHTTALQDRAELHLLCGRPEEAVSILSGLLAQRPYQDQPITQLMVALTRSGRRVEALDAYHRHRRGLAEEFGLEPSTGLQRLHVDILRDRLPSPALQAPRLVELIVPRQLPIDVHGFTGRQAQLRQLDQLLAPPTGDAMTTFSIAGPAGIGKTALAVHWAHLRESHFPDGQLYLDLRGYDPAGQPTEPATAVRSFLNALGLQPDRIPPDSDAQVALFRSRMAGRRVLLVLDNARDAQQVRPLLPGGPGCRVLITSRHQLLGLSASHGAGVIALDQLSEADATRLLCARLGTQRVNSEPVAAGEIVRHCAGLPLALAIIAARAASRPKDPLAHVAARISAARRRLDPFQTADVGTDLRAVFSWSQRWLSPAARKLFRFLGLHPGPEVSLPAAARLVDLPEADAASLLTELADANLISEGAPGRYTLHDLVHAYAAEQARHGGPEGHSGKAMRRLIDHYVLHVDAADRLINLYRRVRDPQRDPPAGAALPFEDEAGAIEWLNTERACVLATLRATASECDTSTWRLGLAIAHYLYRHGYWAEQLATGATALAAARRSGAAGAVIHASINIGRAYIQTCQHNLAEDHLREAIGLAQSTHDTEGHAIALHVMSWVLDLQSKPGEAIARAEQALALFRSAGHVAGQATALNTLGWFHTRLGDHRRALELCRTALRLQQKLGHREGQAATWHSLGLAHFHLGDQPQALFCYGNALQLYRALRNPYFTGFTLTGIGDSHQAMGRCDEAVQAWRKARVILEEIDHPLAETVRAKLADIVTITVR